MSASSDRPGLAREAGAFLLVAVAIRAVLLAVDTSPRFFLGDSASYVWTRLPDRVPFDRSWTYGEALNRFLLFSHSLSSFLIVQSLLSACLCASVALLCRALGVRRALAWAALVLASLEPLLLYYDRSIMTDAPGAVATWGGLALATVALVSRRPAFAVLGAALFTIALTLRTAVFPLVAWTGFVCLALGIAATLRSRSSSLDPHPTSAPAGRHSVSVPPVVAPVVLCLGILAGTLWYARATGSLAHAPPSLNPRSGYFLVGSMAPILAPEDFRGLGVRDPAGLLAAAHASDHSLRNSQIHLEGGVAHRLHLELGDWQEVSRAGEIAARRAILRDPVGFAGIFLENLRGFASVRIQRLAFDGTFGLTRPLPDLVVDLLNQKTWDHVTPEVVNRPSVVLGWLRWNVRPIVAEVWLAFLLPLALFAAWRWLSRSARAAAVVLGTGAWAYMGSIVAISTDAPIRYVLPMMPVVLTLAAILLEALLAPDRD